MGAHTPGPWHFREFEPDGPLADAVYSSADCTLGGDIVCLSPKNDGYEYSAAYWEANSRLIAAATELVAVARYAVDNPDFDSAGLDRMARAAIAKATGGEQ